MAAIQWSRYQAVVENEFSRRWLQIQVDLGLAQNTVDAYARGLDEYLRFVRSRAVPAISAGRETIAAYVGFLRKPSEDNGRLVCISGSHRLSNATLQQRLTVCRLL
jgi:site-specific recombinase XerD